MNTAKQQAIQKAYGKYWELVENEVIEDGYAPYRLLKGHNTDLVFDFKQMHIVYGSSESYVRPKSLAGIETNNGWIRIESEADLPKEYGYYHLIWLDAQNKERNEIYKVDNHGVNCPRSVCITHYQPIIKPNAPIY